MEWQVFKRRSYQDSLWIVSPLIVAMLFVFHSQDPTKMGRSKASAELVEFGEKLKHQVVQFSLFSKAQTEIKSDRVTIELPSSELFVVGTSDLTKQAETQFKALGTILKMASQDYRIIIEGHTDSSPVVKNKYRYPTNWELSGARAFQIARTFQALGIPGSKLEGVGYGATRPKADRDVANAKAKSKEADRRIVLHIVPSNI